MQFSDNVKALIFDCDGTLVDSGRAHLAAWQKAIEEMGGHYDEAFLVLRNGLPLARIIDDYNLNFNARIKVEDFELLKNSYVQEQLKYVQEIPQITSILLNNYHAYRSVVFSGGNRQDVHLSLAVNGLLDKFDAIITADDDFPAKDQPDAYIQIADSLGVNVDECHFFEDGVYAIEAARKAGMQVTDVNAFLSEGLLLIN